MCSSQETYSSIFSFYFGKIPPANIETAYGGIEKKFPGVLCYLHPKERLMAPVNVISSKKKGYLKLPKTRSTW